MELEEFRRLGYRLIDQIVEYRQTLADQPVWPATTPGQVRAALPATAPEYGEPADQVVDQLLDAITPHLSHWQHPRFFGYFPANAGLASVLGDLLSSGLGQLGLNWQSSPALTEVEELTTDWMRQLLGLSTDWRGVIQDSASTASLVALLSARERSSGHCQVHGGLQALTAPLMIYTTVHSHSSIEKAALLAGFGRQNIRFVAHDASYAMLPVALEAAIAEDRAAGRVPCAVVACVGTTATTAVDPLIALGPMCRRENVWLHVDAAMAGTAMMLPEMRARWDGIELADSLVLNPHKWLGVVFDTSLYYVRDVQHLVRVMSSNPSYLQTAADGQVTNYRDWGIPLGRRFRALKLYLFLRIEGLTTIQARLRRDIANAHWLAGQVDAAADWQRVAPLTFQTVCVRHTPPGVSGEALEQHTQRWVAALNASGKAYVTPARLDGQWMVRISIGAEATQFADVAALWQEMQAQASASAAAAAAQPGS